MIAQCSAVISHTLHFFILISFMKRIVNVALVSFASALFLVSCVPTRKWKASEAALQSARNDSATLAGKVAALQSNVGQLKQQIGDLNKKINDLNSQYGAASTD